MGIVRKIAGIITLVLIAATACLACHCMELDPSTSFERADAVFLGQVIRGDDPYGEHTFRVLKSWKGAYEPRVVIGNSGLNNAYAFQAGELYLVYAQQFGGELITDACAGNRSILNASDQLRDLQDRPATAIMPPFRNGYAYAYGYGPTYRSRTYLIGTHERQRSFLNIASVTSFTVLLFLSLGIVVPWLGRRIATWWR